MQIARLGRWMQIAALIALPIAIMLELTSSLHRVFHVSQMVIMLIFAVVLFYLGRVVEGYGQS